MKLYISSDMEGIAGVCSWEQVDARTPHPEHAIFRRHYTLEVAAAIEGARAAGVTDVLANDSHGPMRNYVFDVLPSDVRVIFGNRKPFSMVQDGDGGYGGAFFIGYHGGIGDANAVLCHTYAPSVIYEARVNGIVCSEATLNAALLGYWGVPLLLVTGDRTTVQGVQSQMPWVRGAIVKESFGNFAAESLTPAAAQALIRDAAHDAVTNARDARPFAFEAPITLEVHLVTTAQADLVEMIPRFARTGPRSVQFTAQDFPSVFKAFVATFRMGALA